MIILLLIQTYWFVVTAFSANLEKHRDELDGIAGALRVMNVLAEEMRQDPQIQNLEQMKPSQETSDMPQTVRQEQESPDKPQETPQKFVNNPQLLDSIKNSIETLLANNSMLAALVLTRDPTFQLTSIGSLDLENKRYRTQRLIAMIQNEKAVLQEPWKVLWYLVMAPTDQEDNKYTNDKQDLTARGSMDKESRLKREREHVGARFQDDFQKEQLKIGAIIADENLEQVLSHQNRYQQF